jgi:uncharacterized membrane protein YgdD (TMEM256/DUF423 family)
MERVWIGIGGLLGATAVAMAAVAAHGLAGRYDATAIQQVRSALQIQGWHALALLAVALWSRRGGWAAQAAGYAFAIGTVLFCGDVYALALAGVHLSGVAPAGGLLLIAGWLLLAGSAFVSP